MDWGAEGLVYVCGEAIAPEATYQIQAIVEGCNELAEPNYSTPLEVETGMWGDLVSEFITEPADCRVSADGYVDCWGLPDFDIDFDDIASVVDKFRGLPGAPSKTRTDLAPQVPDLKIDFVDIPTVVDAFRGLPYPYDGPDECP